MINYTTLENFRKHASLTVRFTAGINTIRAVNEAGKSTLLESIAYALFGTAGLKESIDDVVTYGLSPAKLKVECGFSVAGVDYKIVRTKSGAELTFGRDSVTGQKECTRFIEKLFGADQATAAKLMLARQKDLGGALAEGPTAAGKLIEDLADLGLIDELIAKASENLPSGNTAVQLAAVSTLREQAEGTALIGTMPLLEAARAALKAHATNVTSYNATKKELDELDIEAAQKILGDERFLAQSIESHQASIAGLQATIDAEVPPAPADGAIEALQAEIAAEKGRKDAAKIHDQLVAAKVEEMWDQPMAALLTEIDTVRASEKVAQRSIDEIRAKVAELASVSKAREAQYRVERTKLEGKLVKEATCAFCDKDLADVPEVAVRNSALSKVLQDLEVRAQEDQNKLQAEKDELANQLPGFQKALESSKAYLADLDLVVARNTALAPLYAKAEQYITLDMSTVPALWTWTGPVGPYVDRSAELAQLQAQQKTHLEATSRRAAAQETLMSHQRLLKEQQAKLKALPTKDAQETLELARRLKPQVQVALELAQRSERSLSDAKHELELAEQQNRQAQATAEKAKAQLAAAEALLAEMEANNLLIKKLRAARPVITDKLWAIVLAASSMYAGDVRGEPSALSRVDGKFKINGRPVTGLSGSAEDVLGLAIRFALTKTFLGNVDFVILDEVAAACDDQRELSMLGLLATSGFAQTILVTHSQHSDAFADNIITI